MAETVTERLGVASKRTLGPGEILLDRYRIVEWIGSGSDGLVMRAFDIKEARPVAIKIRHVAVDGSGDDGQRFLREIQAVAVLRSEHVPRLFDFGALPDRTPYMVVEYLEGLDLRELLARQGTLEPGVAVDYILQACDALAEAHALGIIHRDFKPANLMVVKRTDASDLIKVLDFGCAKAAGSELTHTGSLIGTPAYMSPEQISGRRTVDARSDIWSVGAVLYHLVEGRLPFAAQHLPDLAAQVASAPHPPLVTAPQLAPVIDRCLNKNPSDRYASIDELAHALRPFWSRPSVAPAVERQTHAASPVPSFARYRVLGRLASGGMGDVWLARAKGPAGFEKLVVLKTIRAGSTTATSMFLREARIAAMLSHPNCVQVFELGEQDGNYFIVMEFIDGLSLARASRRTEQRCVTIPLQVAARIAIDAASGLEYAHTLCDLEGTPLGIVHRDVSLENVLVTFNGQTKLVDFGIAKAANTLSDAETQTNQGVIKGKVGYMAPEYLQGQSCGPPADVFALGVVLYRALTGKRPFEGDTEVQVLTQILQAPPRPIRELRSEVSPELEAVIGKALAKDPAARFASARAMRQAIAAAVPDAADTDGVASFMTSLWPETDPDRIAVRRLIAGEELDSKPVLTPLAPSSRRATEQTAARDSAVASPTPAKRRRRLVVVGAILVLGLTVTGGILARTFSTRHHAPVVAFTPRGPMQVLVADFRNLTGESLFDGSIEIMLGMALEEAPLIATYPRGYAHKALADLGKPRLDADAARAIAVREDVAGVVSGTIDKNGAGFVISVRAIDAASGNPIVDAKRQVARKEDVLRIMAELAIPLRHGFGDTTPEQVQRSALERYTTMSLEAAHAYAGARELLDAMDNRGAIAVLQHVIELDPDFAAAYTALAAAYLNSADVEHARHAFELAFAHIDRMSDRQRFATRGMYYATQGEPKKALDVYNKMLERFPDDRVALRHLAQTHAMLNQFPQALAVTRRILERNPKDLLARTNAASYTAATGDFRAAVEQLTQVIKLQPDNAQVRWSLGMAYVLDDRLPEASAVFRQMQAMRGGVSSGTQNLAGVAVVEGRTRDALAILASGIAADLQHQEKFEAGFKEWLRGHVHRIRNESTEALAALDRATATSDDPYVTFLAAREYIALGAISKAKEIAAQIATHVDTVTATSAQILQAELAFQASQRADAIRILEAAQQSVDTWIGTFDLGLAYLDRGSYPQAHEAFSACVQRRGELGVLFPLFPPTWYFLGRAQEALKSPDAADSYRKYLAVRASADADLFVEDAKRRLSHMR